MPGAELSSKPPLPLLTSHLDLQKTPWTPPDWSGDGADLVESRRGQIQLPKLWYPRPPMPKAFVGVGTEASSLQTRGMEKAWEQTGA